PPARAGRQQTLCLQASQAAGAWRRPSVPDTTTSVLIGEIRAGLDTLPTTNTFPAATPAVLKSTNDKFEVKGDGSGHWGNFNVDADGTMSGLIATGEIVVAVDEGGTAKQFTINLPPGRFTKPPVVWAQASTGYPQLVSVGVPVVE